MTREEAIEILNETQVVYFAPNGKAKVQEALDMAIEALSADSVPHGRLIDADALIFELEEWKKNPNNDDSAVDLVNHFIGIIKAEPSADTVMRDATAKERASVQRYIDNISTEAVQVVRCKDCKWYKKIVEKSKSGLCHYDLVARCLHDEDFCSHGERREL